jgi:hypothetical protein
MKLKRKYTSKIQQETHTRATEKKRDKPRLHTEDKLVREVSAKQRPTEQKRAASEVPAQLRTKDGSKPNPRNPKDSKRHGQEDTDKKTRQDRKSLNSPTFPVVHDDDDDDEDDDDDVIYVCIYLGY